MSTLQEEKKSTKSTGFILSMLGRSKAYYGQSFINCYLGDGERPEYNKHLFLLFNFSNDSQFAWIDKQLESHSELIERYDVEGGEGVMFVFKVPEEYEKDLQRFKKGKYSELSQKLKQETLKLNDLGPDSNVFSAYTKGKKLKRYWAEKFGVDEAVIDEVLSPPDPREEVFRYKTKAGYPKYVAEEIDHAWEVAFKEDEPSRACICKIPAYYKNSEKIAKKIALLLDSTKFDLSS